MGGLRKLPKVDDVAKLAEAYNGGYRKSLPAHLENEFDVALDDVDRLSVNPEIAVLRLRNQSLLRQLDQNSLESRFRCISDARDDLEAAKKCGDHDLMEQAVDQMLLALDKHPDEAVVMSEFRINAEQIRKMSETEVKRLSRQLMVMYQEQVNALKAGIVTAIRKHVADHYTLDALAQDISRVFSR